MKSDRTIFFELLRIKYIIKINMREINFRLPVHFYTNAFDYEIKFAIIQFYVSINVNISKNDFVKIFVIYDFFILLSARRKYFIYKRKFYVIVTFINKYDYFCKHFYISMIIHTNHKPIIHFLKSDLHEEIYEH